MTVTKQTESLLNRFLGSAFSDDLHEYRKEALHDCIIGALAGMSFMPADIGRNMMSKNGTQENNRMKRTYRLISNDHLDQKSMNKIFMRRFRSLIKELPVIILPFDWTTLFERFNLLSVSLSTQSGRTIPIAYNGYKIGNLGEYESQNKFEEEMLDMIIKHIPKKKRAIFIGDRGFDRPEIPQMFIDRKVNFIIRVSVGCNIRFSNGKIITLQKDTIKPGETRDFGVVTYTQTYPVKLRLVAVWDKGMEEAWYLLTNILNKKVRKIVRYYSYRMEIEEMFRSKKNIRSGFKMKCSRLRTIDRWIRLAFISTLLFQFLACVALSYTEWKKVENRYSLCRRKKRIYSIYRLAVIILKDALVLNELRKIPVIFRLYKKRQFCG